MEGLHTNNAKYSLGNSNILRDKRKKNLRKGLRKNKEGEKPSEYSVIVLKSISEGRGSHSE